MMMGALTCGRGTLLLALGALVAHAHAEGSTNADIGPTLKKAKPKGPTFQPGLTAQAPPPPCPVPAPNDAFPISHHQSPCELPQAWATLRRWIQTIRLGRTFATWSTR